MKIKKKHAIEAYQIIIDARGYYTSYHERDDSEKFTEFLDGMSRINELSVLMGMPSFKLNGDDQHLMIIAYLNHLEWLSCIITQWLRQHN